MTAQIDAWVAQAEKAAGEGRWADAERLWGNVAKAAPDHGLALHRLGIHAFQRGAYLEAETVLARACTLIPQDPMVALMLANARRELGQIEGEFAALQLALSADAYFYPALLAKGALYERQGRLKLAAVTYRNVLKIAPPEAHWPPSLAPGLARAAKLVRDYQEAFAITLFEAVGGAGGLSGQWQEAISIMSGQTKPYHADCNQLQVPRLPAIPFFDPKDFPWVPAIEAQTAAITEELKSALERQQDAFQPYIAYKPGDPVNQWAELNHSQRWSSLSLWRGGVRDETNLAACPKTAAALEEVEMAEIGGLCPNAMFSALAPHTEIPPHHGETNARLVVHLPLVVPNNCLYRVGFEQRRWEVGKVLIFDDTLEHMARNDSDELRVVLIFDVWNPLLSREERALVQTLTQTARQFSME
ncbi:MAG: aspartyl/asparaginyl beta-hydroxylase domain-containing protein [Hyphomonadaceae bacterium]